MNNLIKLLVAMLFSSPVLADMNSEINHLLNYVETTGCTYERNGNMYTGKEAVEHIKNKYDYFFDDIETTEDFIKLSATQSTMSGEYYLIHCPNKPVIKSKDWLLNELMKFRRN